MSDNISRIATELSNKIAGQIDAHLIESIVSLFNRGVLVHYVRNARTTFNTESCHMTVDAASGVKFEGRERIIELEQQLKQRDELIREVERDLEQYNDTYKRMNGSDFPIIKRVLNKVQAIINKKNY